MISLKVICTWAILLWSYLFILFVKGTEMHWWIRKNSLGFANQRDWFLNRRRDRTWGEFSLKGPSAVCSGYANWEYYGCRRGKRPKASPGKAVWLPAEISPGGRQRCWETGNPQWSRWWSSRISILQWQWWVSLYCYFTLFLHSLWIFNLVLYCNNLFILKHRIILVQFFYWSNNVLNHQTFIDSLKRCY